MLRRCTEKKIDENYTRKLRAILNKSWKRHSTKQQLLGHLPPISKPILARRTRHAGHSWRRKDGYVLINICRNPILIPDAWMLGYGKKNNCTDSSSDKLKKFHTRWRGHCWEEWNLKSEAEYLLIVTQNMHDWAGKVIH